MCFTHDDCGSYSLALNSAAARGSNGPRWSLLMRRLCISGACAVVMIADGFVFCPLLGASEQAAPAATAATAGSAADLADSLDAFRDPKDGWLTCSDVALDPNNPKKLVFEPGKGLLLSLGEGKDLSTKQNFRDCRVELDFMIPKGANAGVKLSGCYEIQILDSFGKTKLTGSDCGGIYPRAELKPRYRTIDDGVPPRVNACREPGQWQSLVIVFRAPRFDAAGKKTANARFELVKLNGKVIHENQEVAYPTGHAWHNAEKPEGPVLLQGDHGPVVINNLRITPLVD